MFGFYEMYIPTFLQTGSSRKHHGSLGSSFLFGALSGTVASPCLSPGLALVLGIVAALGSKLLGFLLLFAFGIGLSIPLMIIGTFSGSLSVLPRAGYWMIEVKKLFGFLLLGMCFYYLKNILPYHLLLWAIAVFCALSGIYYLYTITGHDTTFWKRTKNLVGILFIVAAVLVGIQAYEQSFQLLEEHDTFWITDYETAVQTSHQEHRLLFIDFWAPSCSICTAIEKIHFKNPQVREALGRFIPVKLELVMSDPVIARLKKEFNIMGLPAIILYNPVNKKIVKRWGSELYQTDRETFISELKAYH
jgi:thiol:disulfide interchange protein DsbD